MLYLGYSCLSTAYNIRILALEEYGPVIHEFDPYFNYRATEVSFKSKNCVGGNVMDLSGMFLYFDDADVPHIENSSFCFDFILLISK